MISPKVIVVALLVAVCVFPLADANLLSENPSGLKGRVVYRLDRAPIRNVYVLVHRNGESDKDVRTDKSGEYSIRLSPNTYDVFLSAEGFAPLCRKVEVKPDGMVVFDAVLEFSPVGMQE